MVEIQTVVGMNEAAASCCKDTLIVPSEVMICLMPQHPAPVVKPVSHVEQPTVRVRETLWLGAHVWHAGNLRHQDDTDAVVLDTQLKWHFQRSFIFMQFSPCVLTWHLNVL